MTKKQQSFADIMNSFGYRYDTRQVFEDFLTMAMCAVTPIPGAGISHYEDQYLETVAKYKNDEERHLFPKLFAQLVAEMEDNVHSGQGNDVLGNYYEQSFSKKNSGQFFTPYPICQFMAHATCGEKSDKPLQRVIDPCCGSGRMVVASSRVLGPGHEYYAIDIDHTCVKMTALNLFFNGIFNSEVMCADALAPGDFRVSYKISLLPLGIFKIEEKEKSRLWHLYRNSVSAINRSKQTDTEDSLSGGKPNLGNQPQLTLF